MQIFCIQCGFASQDDFSEAEGLLIGVTAIAGSLPGKPQNAAFDAPTQVSLNRWDVDGPVTKARFGAFVADAELFDAAAFGIARQGLVTNTFMLQLYMSCIDYRS